jgi:hypothetical protein
MYIDSGCKTRAKPVVPPRPLSGRRRCAAGLLVVTPKAASSPRRALGKCRRTNRVAHPLPAANETVIYPGADPPPGKELETLAR